MQMDTPKVGCECGFFPDLDTISEFERIRSTQLQLPKLLMDEREALHSTLSGKEADTAWISIPIHPG